MERRDSTPARLGVQLLKCHRRISEQSAAIQEIPLVNVPWDCLGLAGSDKPDYLNVGGIYALLQLF